jgi:RimJ/RimL family protein N-acetyltransferase
MDRIVTHRLVLRRAREEDVEAMHAVLSDPVAMRYWSTLPHETIEVTRKWIADMMAPDSARDDYVIEHEGRTVGKAGCYRLPQIGYILHRELWGRGLATEALSAVIARTFERHDLRRLTADVDPRNRPSLNLLGRLGFKVTARARNTWYIGGVWHDSVYLELSRPASSEPTRRRPPANG